MLFTLKFLSRASDNPHGVFRIGSNTQRITVGKDLSRVLSFKIQRTGGRFGDVRVNYQLVYSRNYPGSLNGFLVIHDGENEKTKSVVLDENSFLYFSSRFTLTLSGVMFQGDGVSDILPKLNPSASTEDIPVPELAANSLVKFKDGYKALTVNQGIVLLNVKDERSITRRERLHESNKFYLGGINKLRIWCDNQTISQQITKFPVSSSHVMVSMAIPQCQ